MSANNPERKQNWPTPRASGGAGARWQAALFRLSSELATAIEEWDICGRVVQTLHDTLGYDFVALLLLDEFTGYRNLAASVGYVNPPSPIKPGQGLSEQPLIDGRLQYTPDVTQDQRYFYGMGGSEVDAPISIGGKILGVLTAESKKKHAFCQDDFEVLTVAAQQAALAIEKARLFTAERKRADELEALRRTMADITAELELSSLLKVIVERAASLLDASGGELGLVDEMTREIEIVVSHNLSRDYIGSRQALGEGAMGRVAESGETLIIDNYQTWEGSMVAYPDIYASIAAPLKVGDRILGVFSTVSTDPERKFTSTDLHLLNLFAQQAAIAINNANLFEGTQREIVERGRVEAELREYQDHLEELVDQRTCELKQSEQRYHSLFDGMPIGLYRTTPEGEFMDANPALVQMLGYPDRETLLAVDTASNYVRPEEQAEWKKTMEREGVVRDFETQLYKFDGTVIWGKETARAVKDNACQVLYYEGSFEDISTRKQAEAELHRYQEHLEELVEERTAELRESEKRYRTLFDRVPVGLYRSTPEGELVDTNLAMVQMLGYPERETLLGVDSIEHYVDPQDQLRWKALLEREDVVRNFEGQYQRYDGSIFWFNETTRAVRDETGKVLYYEGSLEDITERKKIESELRHQKEYYEALFINSPVAVISCDIEGTIVSWNPIAEKLFGYSEEEVLGNNLDNIVADNETLIAEANEYSRQVIEVGQVQAITKRTRRDGTLIDVELLALPVVVGDETVGFIVIYVDITDLQAARRQAEAANQAKSTFLANMSHELRTPLNAILGFTQLMEHDPNLTLTQLENLKIINRSGEHLLNLINDVLEMSKIEAGRIRLQEKSFDLHILLEGLNDIFRLSCEEKGLKLRLELSDYVPRYITADEGKLRQVLTNLLSNAVKFTQIGHIILRVDAFMDEIIKDCCNTHSNVRLFFQVEDSGPGIAPENLPLIFEPFGQALHDQHYYEGTGLGLSISQQFVQLMGGELTVRSELGKGSIFLFDIEVSLADERDIDLFMPVKRIVGIEPGQTKYRILIVEEQESNRRLLAELLNPFGFEIIEAENGLQAIELWRQRQPHLIWMDLRMPVLDGFEATKMIKSSPENSNTVIIALTASAFEEDRENILAHGCDDFLRKPFRQEEIFTMLSKHLGVRFIYEEQTRGEVPLSPDDAEAQLLNLASEASIYNRLSSEWLSELKQATIKADQSTMLDLINKIKQDEPALASALNDLTENFDYQEILTFLTEVEQ